jgi:hypothetical protein
LRRLNGGDPELSISDNDWKRIELAYGHPVPRNAREQIHGATLTFLFFVQGEQAARPVSEARTRVLQINKAAAAFQKAVFDLKIGTLDFMRIIWSADISMTNASRADGGPQRLQG